MHVVHNVKRNLNCVGKAKAKSSHVNVDIAKSYQHSKNATKKSSGKVDKRTVQKYLKNQNKEEEP